MSYTHLSTIERNCLGIYCEQGQSISKIAKILNRNKSTISREIKRNKNGNGYNPALAEKQYRKRKQLCGAKSKIRKGNELYERVVNGLELDWSAEQIANTIAKDVSISTIYRAFHKKILSHLAKHFRILTYQRGWRKNHKRGNTFKGCKSIHERPKEVLKREEFGHWELDTMVFSRKEQQVLAVFVERKFGYGIEVLLKDKKAETMKAAIVETFKKLPYECRKTLTVDRGKEFEFWREIENELKGTEVYFCDPMSPEQKGSVENTNGLLRQYYPKNKNTQAPTPEALAIVQASLNNRPRKRLNYQTPNQLFYESLKNCCT